jgi:formiminotetrahydrofolate cyclodeaminase
LRSKIYLEEFLDQTAKRGSWYGGGSTAACACALAAALLEKLATQPSTARLLRTIRTRGVELIHQDATAFARVIEAQGQQHQPAIHRALKQAIAIPLEVWASSQRLLNVAPRISKTMKPRYRVDLRCAVLLAKAARDAARALVTTNLAWLGDQATRRRK